MTDLVTVDDASTTADAENVTADAESMPIQSIASDAVLERFLSVYGITTYADHDSNGTADAGVVDDCKTYSRSFIAGYLSQRYEYANLLLAPLMIEIDAVITLRELCLRRGNAPPASLEMKYQEIVAENGLLDKIRHGTLPLVDENGNRLPQRAGAYCPSWANLQLDLRFSERKIRVTDGTSNMAPSPLRRNVDRWREVDQW